MQKSRANLARIAARAAASTSNTVRSNPVALSGVHLTPLTKTLPVGFEGVRRHGNKRSGKGGSSTGGCNGMWRTVSPSYKDAVTIDSKWSQTVRSQNV